MTTPPATARTQQSQGLPANLADMALTAVARHSGAALRYKRDGRWLDLSYPDFGARARAIAAGLIALGIEPGDRVAILANTIPEWTIADIGILCAGAVVVPVYFTNSPHECLHVLSHSGARAVFVEDDAQLAKIRQIRDRCPSLEHVIALWDGPDAPSGDDALAIDELLRAGDAVAEDDIDAAGRTPVAGDPATIVYTSGTTGDPKGCIITHGNVLATIGMYEDQLHLANDEHPVVYMFLPLAHVLARAVELVTIQEGGTLAFWTRDPAHLLADLAEVRPTHFPSVPRVFEKVHTAALVAVEGDGALQQRVFRSALALGKRRSRAAAAGQRLGVADRLRAPLADRLVFSKVHALFGGRLRKALTGAAPIGPDVVDFFDACGIPLLEGYGMTETCAAATLNTDEAHRAGTVGRALPGVRLKIANDGEVLMRGPNISPGYYRDPEATAELFDADGWLCSGDLGTIDDGGYLSITGRKKDLIITSSGKNIGPTAIETRLQETRWISHAVVYGDAKPYLVALLTIDAEEAPELARRAGIPDADPELLAANDAVHAVLQESVDEVSRDFARIEQVKRFGVLDRDLLQAEGELTPTMKIRRAVVYERYGPRFEALYDSCTGGHADLGELGLERVDELGRLGHEGPVGHEADGHASVVGEDADAHADRARARRPHEDARDRHARQGDRRARPRHVREDHHGLRRHQVDDARLDGGGHPADRVEDPVGHLALARALQREHPHRDLVQAAGGVLDRRRQAQDHEAETVAQVARQRLVEWPQVERHHCGRVLGLPVVREQVRAHGSGHARHEQVVDGRAAQVPDPADLRERERARPRRAPGRPERPVQRGLLLGGRAQQLEERRAVGAALACEVRDAARVQERLDGRMHPGLGDGAAGCGPAAQRRRDPAQRPRTRIGRVLVVGSAMSAPRPPSPRSSVRESITRASAMPSAIAWCIRTTIAHPSP